MIERLLVVLFLDDDGVMMRSVAVVVSEYYIERRHAS